MEVWVSPELLQEYREVPLELFSEGKITRDQLLALIAGIAAFTARAKVSYPKERLSLCRDPEDNMLLECCLSSKAHFLITSDKDLLEINREALKGAALGKLEILSPKEFLDKAA